MNYVNLIGKISSEPKVMNLENGRKIANFSIKTEETYLDKEGNVQKKSQWHRVSAWGKWVAILEQFGEKGLQLAIEGRLTSRFYKTPKGENRFISEVEVNDLVLL
jgi:single-strand DNA-binding protein